MLTFVTHISACFTLPYVTFILQVLRQSTIHVQIALGVETEANHQYFYYQYTHLFYPQLNYLTFDSVITECNSSRQQQRLLEN